MIALGWHMRNKAIISMKCKARQGGLEPKMMQHKLIVAPFANIRGVGGFWWGMGIHTWKETIYSVWLNFACPWDH